MSTHSENDRAEIDSVAMLRRMYRLCLGLVGAIFLCLIFSGRLLMGPGDASQRAMLSFEWAQGFLGKCTVDNVFNSIWVPGQFMLQALLFKGLMSLGVSITEAYLKALQCVMLAVGLLGVVSLASGVRRVSGPRSGWCVGVVLCALPAILSEFCSGMTEIYAFALVGAGIYCVAQFLTREYSGRWLIAAGLAFLGANLFRNEVIVLTGATVFFLMIRRRIVSSVVFGTLGSSYFAGKLLFTFLYPLKEGSNFITYNRAHYKWGEGFLDYLPVLGRLLLGLAVKDGPVLLLLAVALLLLSGSPRRAWKNLRVSPLSAYWLTLLIFFGGYVLVAVFGGIMTQEVRYVMFLAVFPAVFLADALGHALSEGAASPRMQRLVLRLLPVGGACLFLFGMAVFSAFTARFPKEFGDTVDWINAHKTPDDAIQADFLNYYEQPLLLYTRSPFHPCLSQMYSSGPRSKRPVPAEDWKPERSGDRITMMAHWHLVDYRPKYVVFAAPGFYARIRQQRLIGFHHRHSYLRPYLDGEPPAAALRLQSPYLNPGEQVTLVRAYGNAMFEVYAVHVETPDKQ